MATMDDQANGAHGFGQRIDTLGSSAQQFWNEAREAAQELQQTLDIRGRVERNPYGMMAAAVAVGYVLGGGLFTSFTGNLIRMGIRLAALPLVKDELGGLVGAAFQGSRRPGAGAEPEAGWPSRPGPNGRTRSESPHRVSGLSSRGWPR